jgi:hypothetical protein
MIPSIIAALLAFIATNPEIITLGAVAIFEAIVRRKATEKDYSIINLIKRIIDALIKNRKKPGDQYFK